MVVLSKEPKVIDCISIHIQFWLKLKLIYFQKVFTNDVFIVVENR